MVPINYLAVVIATVAGMLVGWIWYGPLFGRAWRRLAGDPQTKPAVIYPLTLVATFATAFVLAYVTSATSIALGNALLAIAMRRMQPGSYQLQALIAAKHANARTAADTDWTGIAALYAQLERMTQNPVVSLNRAVAVAMADGPLAGLALLDGLHGLDDYHLFHSTRGELLRRAGLPDRQAFERALALATNPAEQRHLRQRLREAGSIE